MKNDGYTGRNFNRPGFQAMLAEAEAGKIGTITVKDMSRFCRNYLEVGFYTEILFPKKQIRFVAINNSVDSDKPQDNDFTPFLNIMNEWYAKDTSNKISRARQKRRSNTALFCYPEATNSGFGRFCVSGANRQFGSEKEVPAMPRMPKYLKREWAFFLDERGRKKYN